MEIIDMVPVLAQIEVPIQDLVKEYGWLVAISISIILQIVGQIFAKRDAELTAQKIINQQFVGLTDENKKLRLRVVQKDKKILELTLRADETGDENLVLKGQLKDQSGRIENLTASLQIVEESGIFKLTHDGKLIKVGGSNHDNGDIISTK